MRRNGCVRPGPMGPRKLPGEVKGTPSARPEDAVLIEIFLRACSVGHSIKSGQGNFGKSRKGMVSVLPKPPVEAERRISIHLSSKRAGPGVDHGQQRSGHHHFGSLWQPRRGCHLHGAFQLVSSVYRFTFLSLMNRAGMPPTMVQAGTSLVTIAPVATTAPSLTLTPGRMVTPAPT